MPNSTAPAPHWSPEHIQILRSMHSTHQCAAIGAAVGGRSAAAVRQKARALGLSGEPGGNRYGSKNSRSTGLAAPGAKAGLQAIPTQAVSNHGKILLSPIASPAELTARRLSERLEAATRVAPVRNSAMGGVYTCPELHTRPSLPPARFAAFDLPSRVGKRLHYPDGRVVEITQ